MGLCVEHREHAEQLSPRIFHSSQLIEGKIQCGCLGKGHVGRAWVAGSRQARQTGSHLPMPSGPPHHMSPAPISLMPKI